MPHTSSRLNPEPGALAGTHTPAQWRTGVIVQNDGSMAVLAPADLEDGPGVPRIARVDDFETAIGAANARLIAAAPELVAVLQALVDSSAPESFPAPDARSIDRARALLRRVKGETE